MGVASVRPAHDGVSTIVLESAAPLPRPAVGVLDDPPRIYFDFAGFRPGPPITPAPPPDGVVRGIRIALNTPDPPVTRIVIDLAERAAYRIDATAAASGRLVVHVGGAPPTRTALPSRTSSLEASGARLGAVMRQLDALRAVLSAIDGGAETSGPALEAAAAQLDSIAGALSAARPTAALRPARDRLAQACLLARQAVQGRMESAASGSAAPAWKAASAAAGALLLLDRAREDLGLPASAGSR